MKSGITWAGKGKVEMSKLVNDFACFDGDTSDIPIDIRRLAVRLKRGATIDYGNDGEFDALIDNADDVRKSLNADFLDLYIDEENRVAWAEAIDGERSFLKKPGLQANNVSLFLAAAMALLERRQDGHENPAEWVTTKTSLKERFTKANAKLEGDGRGSVSSAFDAAYRAARQWHWIDDTGCGEDRCRVTPHVAALIERGFAVELLAAMNGDTEGRLADAE